MQLTKKQKLWLEQHGDRSVDDVYKDDKGFYVEMRDGRLKVWEKVYIPDNPVIINRYQPKVAHN